jgi:DNA helicase-2/ATP-dependent DNA helicase PcrA
MVDAMIDNIYLVNAPAGSGKTTRIKSMIVNHIIEYPNDNILCITYTNRAADELKKGLNTDKVYFGTIHSFLHSFIGIYFSHPQIIDLYFEIYGEDIRKRIANEKGDSNATRSNEKYITKFGDLTYEMVQQNLKSVSYNEAQFNSLYYGGLSHDDLILFAKKIFDRFPIIKKRLTQRYQIIFVDEYQDSSANVLQIFYNAVRCTSTRLYFLGDKMQQIYKNYDGSFESELPTLNRSIALDTNHRSIKLIIDILNNIYNDETYKQDPSPNNLHITPDHAPRVLICDNISKRMEEEKSKHPKALLLFLLNQKRFDSIEAGNIYRQLGRMDRYSFVQQYSAVDVITDDTSDNPDPLIKLLFILNQISEYFASMNLGSIIQLLRMNPRMFDKKIYAVTKHEDKDRLNNLLKSVLDRYNDVGLQYDINAVIIALKETSLVKSEYIELITDSEEYSAILEVKVNEFRAIAQYLKIPNVSTQHGVKGESHDTVFFIAEDSTSTPVVHMYRFFKLWCSTDISLNSFESFYYEYVKWINDTTHYLGFKLSDINKDLHEQYKKYLKERIAELLEYFKDNTIFNNLCGQVYIDYLSQSNVTTAKKCFKETPAYGALCAYRLFYVGCSRARRNLTIFIDKSKINGFSTQLIEKCRATGFTVVE